MKIQSSIKTGKIQVASIKAVAIKKVGVVQIPSKIDKVCQKQGKITVAMLYSPTKSQLDLLRDQLGRQFQLDSNLFLAQKQVQYDEEYPFWKIFTAVGITITGILSYFIPGIGFVAGSAITSAGISGLIQCFTNPDLNWNEFFKEMGIQALVGTATSVISKLGSAVNILNNSKFQAAIKGAIIGAITSSSASLISMGFDPSKEFDWSNVVIQCIIGSICSMHEYKLKCVKDEQLAKQKYWNDLKQKLGGHILEKKETMEILDSRWNICYYKLSEQQKLMFPQLASQNYAVVHNQGLVHFLDYNVIESLAKEKGRRLQLIANILGASVQPEKGVINGYLPQITNKLDEIVGKISPSQITVIGENSLKETLKQGVKLSEYLGSLGENKVAWGVTKIYYHLSENVERGLKLVTYTDLRTNTQKYSTLIPMGIKDILKQIKKIKQ